jgi:hypothetical protein
MRRLLQAEVTSQMKVAPPRYVSSEQVMEFYMRA